MEREAIENSTVVDPVARWVCDGDKKNHTNLEVKALILNIKHMMHHSVHFITHQSFAFY